MFPLTKPAPTDLKKCYHLRGKRYIYNNSISACQYFRRKSISLRRWVHSIECAMVLRKSLIFISVKWWFYIPLEYQKILKNETAVHIVKYMCTALSFHRSRLYIIRLYSVEKSFPIKSSIHCISGLCAAIPRCILTWIFLQLPLMRENCLITALSWKNEHPENCFWAKADMWPSS